jgi:precorrin-3B synthase
MLTGDGLIVRLMPAQSIALDAFVALCAAARAHGNGTMEVTARGSVQVRGLTPRSAPLFASAVGALGIAAIEGVPVIADPLADDSIVDATALAGTLRGAIARAGLALAPKVSVVVDGGGRLHLDALPGDVRLRAIGSAQSPRLHVALGGDAASAAPLGSIAADAAVDVAVRLLGVIAAQGPKARAADILRERGIAAFRSAVSIDPAPDLLPRPGAEPIGRHPLTDGSRALGVAPGFGHAHADALAQLARICARHGVRSIRPAPGRALLLLGVAADSADALASAAEGLGFIARAGDPRRRIAACPGLPACASGLIPARALAAAIARLLPPGRGTVHVSGCSKGCAHPAPAALTVVGTVRGCGIVRRGRANATPGCYVDPIDLAAEIARIADEESEAVHG